MPAETAPLPPALKHAAYSIAALLPGEDKAAFERLHESLVAELAPEGALEDHIVANMARFVWRRDHLGVLHLARIAQKRIDAIRRRELKLTTLESEAVWQKSRAKAREELGDVCDLVEGGITEEEIAREIDLRAKLDDMIDKCLKRLLFVRGLKSMGRPAAPARIAHVPAQEIPIASEVDTSTMHAAG